MKQIISFKKELPFETRVCDITSISLEREVKVEEDSVVTGVFHISGDYKMNEGSISREKFSFDLPFDISIDPRYDTNTIECDVEDFYYDLINNDTLKVNIDLYVKAEYLPETDEHEEFEEMDESINKLQDDCDRKEESLFCKEETNPIDLELPVDELSDSKREEKENFESDLFSNLDNNETYVTYFVYIVKEEDNIDKILNKYGVSKEDLESYNDITNIKIGDKLIIPKCNEK